VTDHAARSQIEIDVAVLAPAEPGQPRAIISLGEAKWGDVMGVRHIARLQRAQSVLENKGFDVSRTILACYSGGDSTRRSKSWRAAKKVSVRTAPLGHESC
jgi:hypothetical protein